jgi:hypothetical protein
MKYLKLTVVEWYDVSPYFERLLPFMTDRNKYSQTLENNDHFVYVERLPTMELLDTAAQFGVKPETPIELEFWNEIHTNKLV